MKCILLHTETVQSGPKLNQNRCKVRVQDPYSVLWLPNRHLLLLMATKLTENVLKLVYWNTNGVLSKTQGLINFLFEEEVDVMVLRETWLNNNQAFKIPNCVTYRNTFITILQQEIPLLRLPLNYSPFACWPIN